MALTCYTDAGGSGSEIVLSPATLVSTPEKWIEFDVQWNECLAAFDVTALHMKDFAHSKREFESWRWNEPKRRRFLRGLMSIIEELIEYTAAVAVYSADYAEVDKEYELSESMRPYTMGCLGCASRVVLWAKEKGISRNDLIWVYEKGDLDQADLKKHWDIAYPNGDVDPIFKRKCDSYPGDDTRRIRPFEAADLIAYENLHAHRLIERTQGQPVFEDLRKPMQRMFNFPGANMWGYFSKAEMISACDMWAIRKRCGQMST